MSRKSKRVSPVKRKKYDVCPAPAEGIMVCTICGRQPETCGHAHDKMTPDALRESCVWCCDWIPRKEAGND